MVFIKAVRGSGKNLLMGYKDFPPRSLVQTQNLLVSDWKSLPVGRSLAGGQGHVGAVFLQLLEETTTWQEATMGSMRIQELNYQFSFKQLVTYQVKHVYQFNRKGPTKLFQCISLSFFSFVVLVHTHQLFICTWVMIFFKLRCWYVTLY